MSRRVLITGGAGFVGQWLSRAVLARGWSVHAGTHAGPPSGGVLTDAEKNAICWSPLDVTSGDSVRRAVATSAPDQVVHLAGIAHAPVANRSPLRAFEVNALGVLRLFAALESAGRVRVLVVGSAEQYGQQDAAAYPVAETAMLRPLTPYAASKAAQEVIALQAYRAGTDVVCTRSFNHSGVGHGDDYLLPTLVRRVRELPRSGGTLRIGNGTPVRDFLHVADVVEAYLGLLDRGVSGEVYNVSSGEAATVRELAERVLKRAGTTADISSDATLLRSIDVPVLLGDNRKLRDATGWTPTRSIDDIIDDLIHATAR